MQVPERSVAATGSREDAPWSRPADLLRSTPFKPQALKTPRRVPPRSQRPLGFPDLERPPPSPQYEDTRAAGRLRRERSMSGHAVRPKGQLLRRESEATIEGPSEELTAEDAASLRRQIIKLNRRLQLLEEESKGRAKREMVMYSITVAFWLLNSWLWFRR